VETRDAIRHYAHGIGDDNPLWCEPEYAAKAQGHTAAPPSFVFALNRSFSGYVGGLPGVVRDRVIGLALAAKIRVDERPLRFDTGDDAPLRFEPDDTGPLPNWTEPPTGEVPRIFAEDIATDDLDEFMRSMRQPSADKQYADGGASH